MGNLFDREATKAVVRPKITDQTGLSYFATAIDSIVDPTTANTISSEADAKRLGSFADQHKAAYLYLALAFRLIETPSLMATSPGKMFHFAGHAFRGIGQLNRAADAYWRAGVMTPKMECQ